jgi:hypothetical protein
MPGEERGAKRTSSITWCRLNPDSIENSFTQILALATQLSATPPARQKFFWFVSFRTFFACDT